MDGDLSGREKLERTVVMGVCGSAVLEV